MHIPLQASTGDTGGRAPGYMADYNVAEDTPFTPAQRYAREMRAPDKLQDGSAYCTPAEQGSWCAGISTAYNTLGSNVRTTL